MKRNIAILVSILSICFSFKLWANDPVPIPDRLLALNFQGQIVDEDGLSYDGMTDIEAWFYKNESRESSELIYAEEFVGAKVERGLFRVGLLTGDSLDSTNFSWDSLNDSSEIFVDIKVNNNLFLELYPLGSSFAAIRSEVARVAENLRQPLVLPVEAVPEHNASKITTGTLSKSVIPKISGGKIKSLGGETLSLQQIPVGIDPSSISQSGSGDKFPESAIPADLDASENIKAKDQNDKLSIDVISGEVLRNDGFSFKSGSTVDGGLVLVPDEFKNDRSKCSWVVGLRVLPDESLVCGGTRGLNKFIVTTDQNGVVNCEYDCDHGDMDHDLHCEVNYMSICRK